MSVRFDASGDNVKRTANVPSSALYTACGWAHQIASTGNWTCLATLENGSEINMQFDVSGNQLMCYTSTSGGISLSVTPGTTPFFWFITAAGTGAGQVTFGARLISSNALTVSSADGVAFTPTTLMFGNNLFSEYFNGRMWSIMCWDRVLTAQELLLQSYRSRPINLQALNFWYPMDRHDKLNDYGPNRRDLTISGTLTTEPHAPFRLR